MSRSRSRTYLFLALLALVSHMAFATDDFSDEQKDQKIGLTKEEYKKVTKGLAFTLSNGQLKVTGVVAASCATSDASLDYYRHNGKNLITVNLPAGCEANVSDASYDVKSGAKYASILFSDSIKKINQKLLNNGGKVSIVSVKAGDPEALDDDRIEEIEALGDSAKELKEVSKKNELAQKANNEADALKTTKAELNDKLGQLASLCQKGDASGFSDLIDTIEASQDLVNTLGGNDKLEKLKAKKMALTFQDYLNRMGKAKTESAEKDILDEAEKFLTDNNLSSDDTLDQLYEAYFVARMRPVKAAYNGKIKSRTDGIDSLKVVKLIQTILGDMDTAKADGKLKDETYAKIHKDALTFTKETLKYENEVGTASKLIATAQVAQKYDTDNQAQYNELIGKEAVNAYQECLDAFNDNPQAGISKADKTCKNYRDLGKRSYDKYANSLKHGKDKDDYNQAMAEEQSIYGDSSFFGMFSQPGYIGSLQTQYLQTWYQQVMQMQMAQSYQMYMRMYGGGMGSNMMGMGSNMMNMTGGGASLGMPSLLQ